MKKNIIYLLLCFFMFFSSSVMADEAIDCDPVVSMDQQNNTLQKTLTVLAKKYQFELSFPLDADKSVESVDGMRLSQALKYISTDVNTVLQHEKLEGCELPRLVAMEVLPVGEESEYVYVTSAGEQHHSAQKPQLRKNIKKVESELQAKGEGAVKFRGDADSDEGSDVEQMRKEKARRDYDMRPERIEAAGETQRRGKLELGPGVDQRVINGRTKVDEGAY